jgi:hypothetical protein
MMTMQATTKARVNEYPDYEDEDKKSPSSIMSSLIPTFKQFTS